MAGIGCHTMAVTTNDFTRTFSQMGGEGVPWIGLEHFTDLPHMFANMGDGTYQHSGLLAIRQAVAAKAHITYKLLFNDAVAMTGGQPAEGAPTVTGWRAQLHAEGRRAASPSSPTTRPACPRQRAAARHAPPRPRRAGRRAAPHARAPRRHRHHLRPGLRHREAPPPQARQDGAGGDSG